MRQRPAPALRSLGRDPPARRSHGRAFSGPPRGACLPTHQIRQRQISSLFPSFKNSLSPWLAQRSSVAARRSANPGRSARACRRRRRAYAEPPCRAVRTRCPHRRTCGRTGTTSPAPALVDDCDHDVRDKMQRDHVDGTRLEPSANLLTAPCIGRASPDAVRGHEAEEQVVFATIEMTDEACQHLRAFKLRAQRIQFGPPSRFHGSRSGPVSPP